MIAYIDDFQLMMVIVIVVSLPFLLLLRRPGRIAKPAAVPVD